MNYLLDTHCHFYPQFDPQHWIEAAFKNLSIGRQIINQRDTHSGIILTERSTENYFSAWSQQSPWNESLGYKILSSPSYLQIINTNGEVLILYPGQQFQTAEKLEVLCVSGRLNIPNKLSASETIAEIIRQGHIPVAPWSFGKWLGARRAIVKTLLQQYPNQLYIGDILHRPRFDSLENLTKQSSSKILSGTDPLPMSGDEKKVGTLLTQIQFNGLHQPPTTILEMLSGNPLINQISVKPYNLRHILAEQLRFRIC